MEVDAAIRKFLTDDEQVQKLRFALYRNFISCKANKCLGIPDTEEMNSCIKTCSRPLENQQSYAQHAYADFSSRFSQTLYDQCLSKGKDLTQDAAHLCFKQVETNFKVKESATFKSEFLEYLQFQQKQN